MGNIGLPQLVLPLLAVTSQFDDAFTWAETRLAGAFGPLGLASPRFPFDQTDYYAATMGPHLRKQFLVPQALRDPAELAQWKCATNAWEEEFAATFPAPVCRPLNLDPGYLSQDKLVLASTKNHAHRLYLADGIFAEVTLQYRARQWQICPWTYPDYQQPAYHAFFTQCRDYLRQQLQRRPSPDRPPAD